jgi:formate--tetrahydrofolate ligase
LQDIAARAGIPADALEPQGRHIAKIALPFAADAASRPPGALVLVTGISPPRPGRARPPPPSASGMR